MDSTQHWDTLAWAELINWPLAVILQINFFWGTKAKKRPLQRKLVSEQNEEVTSCHLILFLLCMVIGAAQAA